MNFAFIVSTVLAFSQVYVNAGPITTPEDITPDTTPLATDNLIQDKSEAPSPQETASDVAASHLYLGNADDTNSETQTPNLDAFMEAFDEIDSEQYTAVKTFLDNTVPKLPEYNPITNHFESALFLFELYEKIKNPRDLDTTQEQQFLEDIENFLSSKNLPVFNKAQGFPEQNGDEFNEEPLNDLDDLQNNKQELNLNPESQEKNLKKMEQQQQLNQASLVNANQEPMAVAA